MMNFMRQKKLIEDWKKEGFRSCVFNETKQEKTSQKH